MRTITLTCRIAATICGLWLCGPLPSSAQKDDESRERVETIHLRGGELRLINHYSNLEYQPKAVINGQEFPFYEQYIGHEATFSLSDRDVVVLSSDAGGSGTQPSYRIFSIALNGKAEEITTPDFDTADGTIAGKQKGDVVYFDLGFQDGLKKNAVLVAGHLSISLTKVARPAFSLENCKWLYETLENCPMFNSPASGCSDFDFSLGAFRGIRSLQHHPRWKAGGSRFEKLCTAACEGKKPPPYSQFAKNICGP